MYSRITLIIFLSSLSFAAIGQTAVSPCEVLSKAVSTNEFKRMYYKCSEPPVIIIDTGAHFAGCTLTDSCGRMIPVVNKKINYSPNGIRPGIESKPDIVLYGFEHKGSVYILRFWQPYTNRAIETKLIYKAGKAQVKYEHKGDF